MSYFEVSTWICIDVRIDIATRIQFLSFYCVSIIFYIDSNHPEEDEVQVGKDQEKVQSEKESHSKNRGGKKNKLTIRYLYHETHIVSRISRYFPNRWPLSYINLTKNMKTYIRRQQHKKF